MNAMAAMRQYQNVSTQAQAIDASPHRLIQMLMEGGLTRMAQARGALERGEVALKGELIGKAIAIVGGLREGLDFEAGGELAANLDRLYAYMSMRLTEANLKNDAGKLEEVSELLRNIKSGWDAIAPPERHPQRDQAMSAAVQILEETGSALRVALASQNWEAIGELDQRCRQAVDEAMLDVQDEATLRARMEELLALYRELIDVCQGEQRKLATDLIQLNQSKQGAKVYQMFG